MSVKILSGNWFGGMPTLEYTIVVDGVRITMNEANFKELTEELGEKLSEDYNKAKSLQSRYKKNSDKVIEFRKDIIKLFWDGDDEDIDSWYFKKNINQLDEDKIYEVLNKYNNFLGFE